MSVEKAQREISSHEFAEWMAYYRLEPFGENRQDFRHGILSALIANSNRDPKKQPKPYAPEDFIPDFGSEYDEEYVMTPEETAEVAKQIFGRLAASLEYNELDPPKEAKKLT